MLTDGAEDAAVHGVALTERAIEAVRRDPGASALEYQRVPWVSDGIPAPMPEARLAEARFPSGRPLPPSLRAWLAFDTSLLARHGWFTPDGAFAPRPLSRLVGDEFGEPWAPEFQLFDDRFPECFLLPGGSDSRRFLTVTEPDALGEYPVLALDFDDLPYVGLMYPGFDVYTADTAGLLGLGFSTYSSLIDHGTYGPRMRHHAHHCFDGEPESQFPFCF
ncbi:hypothetical protein [Streptomyces qinzhouensis]|uniref:Uncharacterized protein n=1 Tax=Streptomyces qinzhouensis TaxID=2599401 RepID=A0A5B8IHZ1_9ACTN|nr:hypothetical protein [Streptomyces qinzhouensis]QDY77932.1 hypothetical protein FQU76_17070 [Streptomyces qinzhouensis]